MINEFDVLSMLKITLEEMYGRKMTMVMYTDSKSLFELSIGIK